MTGKIYVDTKNCAPWDKRHHFNVDISLHAKNPDTFMGQPLIQISYGSCAGDRSTFFNVTSIDIMLMVP